MCIGMCVALLLGVFMSCIANLMRRHIATLLHDTGIELKSISAAALMSWLIDTYGKIITATQRGQTIVSWCLLVLSVFEFVVMR